MTRAYYLSNIWMCLIFFDEFLNEILVLIMMKNKRIVIYTSDNCPYCIVAEEIIKQVIDEYQGLFDYKSIKISPDRSNKVLSLPTIKIGDKIIKGIPEKDQIHTALFS